MLVDFFAVQPPKKTNNPLKNVTAHTVAILFQFLCMLHWKNIVPQRFMIPKHAVNRDGMIGKFCSDTVL